jgi:hypothetical protein
MDPITQQTALASAGGKKDPVYVDDVFSTYLWEGNDTARSFNNGIDLAGKGGLVWIKNRDSSREHVLCDTARGAGKTLRSNDASAEQTATQRVSAFSSNGFSVGTDTAVNNNNEGITSWTFRKQKGFFDVVTYTGNSTAGRTVAHNLASVPGMIVIKCTSAQEDWPVYHRSLGATKNLRLNETDVVRTETNKFNDTEPTATQFTLGSSSLVNGSGQNYVAYVFAHDEASFGTDEDESIIKCGSYTGAGSSSDPTISLGFEPQWVILKNTSASASWVMADTMRGWTSSGTGGDAITMCANLDSGEISNGGRIKVTSTGFTMDGEASSAYNTSGQTYIYMAIRRPNKPPEAATEVFAIDTAGGTAPTPPRFTSGFAVDFVLNKQSIDGNSNWLAHSRLTGNNRLYPNTSGAEDTGSAALFDFINGYTDSPHSDVNNIAYMFKRAPGFMDVVAYTGNLTTRTINHNLEAVPELVMVKNRTDTGGANWSVWTKDLTQGYALTLNTDLRAVDREGSQWNAISTFTTTHFGVGNGAATNQNNHRFIGYLFATLPGISKVGSYSGTGSALNIDCGFTNGARFVLIKRTDAAGNWYVFDTVRGIVSGNDFTHALSLTSAQITGDYIDPLAAGFTINGSYVQWNESGGTYLFLAIA